MGDIADDLIDGHSCSWCGIYFVKPHGYPVLCLSCWAGALPTDKKDYQRAMNKEA